MIDTRLANGETRIGRGVSGGSVPLLRRAGGARCKTSQATLVVWLAVAGLIVLTTLAVYTLALAPRHMLGPGFDIAVWAFGVFTIALCLTAWRSIGRFDPFLLPVWFSANLFVQVFFNVWLFNRDEASRYFWLGQDGFPAAAKFLALSSAAGTGLLVGFLLAGKVLGGRQEYASFQGAFRLNRAVWILGVSWGVRILTVFVSEIGFRGRGASVWTNYHSVLDFVSQVALLAVLLLWLKTGNRLAGYIALGGLAMEILPRLYAGSKSFVFPLIWVVACWFYARGRLPMKHLAVGLLLTVTLVPVVNTFRGYLLTEGGGESRAVLFREATGEAFSRGVGGGAEETLETAITRQSGVFHYSAAIVLAHPDQQPFVAGPMLELIAGSLIPRVLWPGKPTTYPDLYLLGVRYMGTAREYSYATPGLVADLYRTGGWPLTVLGTFGLGWLSVFLLRGGPGSWNMAGIALNILLVTMLLTYDRGLYEMSMGILHLGVPGYLVAFHFLSRRPQSGRSGGIARFRGASTVAAPQAARSQAVESSRGPRIWRPNAYPARSSGGFC